MGKRSTPKTGGINREKVFQEEFKTPKSKSTKGGLEINQLAANFNNGDITKKEYIKEIKDLLSKYKDLE